MDMGIKVSDILESIVMLISSFWWIILLLLAPTIIKILINMVTRDSNKSKKRSRKKVTGIDYTKYGLKKSVLTSNELDFYHCLKSVIGGEPVVLSKVRLSDIFYTKKGRGYQAALNRINPRHVDFLLCNPKDFKPFMAIEVDDHSHEKEDRKKRDEFVNGLFEAMKLPILRYKAEKTYLVEEVKEQVSKLLSEHYFDEENGKNSTM